MAVDQMNSNQRLAVAELRPVEAIVEQTPDAINFVDRSGMIQVWNREAEAVFGFSAAEVIGSSLAVIIPERFRPAHWDGFRMALKAGQTKHGGRVRTTRSIHKSGIKVYVDLSFGLVANGAGSVIGAVAVGRDGTARHRKEGQLRARVAELERQAADAVGGPSP